MNSKENKVLRNTFLVFRANQSNNSLLQHFKQLYLIHNFNKKKTYIVCCSLLKEDEKKALLLRRNFLFLKFLSGCFLQEPRERTRSLERYSGSGSEKQRRGLRATASFPVRTILCLTSVKRQTYSTLYTCTGIIALIATL